MRRTWTAADDAKLLELAPKFQAAEIARRMGWSHMTIIRHARALGARITQSDDRERTWEAREKRFILAHPELSCAEIALRLDRPLSSVSYWKRRLEKEATDREKAREARIKAQEKVKAEEDRLFPDSGYRYRGRLRVA